jgi:TonB family protein
MATGEGKMTNVLSRLSVGVLAAVVLTGSTAGAQKTVCDSPCKEVLLPLIKDQTSPVPNSNPLAELQGKVGPAQGAAQTYFEYQVDKKVVPVSGNPWPHYPDSLKTAKVEGEVVVAFTVDTLGRVDSTSVHLLKSTHPLFSAAVREALPGMRFVPAELHGVKVKQLVQQPFVFKIGN